MYGIIEKEVSGMKGSKTTLTNYLTSQFEKNMRNKKSMKAIMDFMINDCNFPVLEVMDTMHLRKRLDDCSDRMLYYYTKVINKDILKDYFSAKEAKEYETTTYKRPNFSFPIRWKMFEIVEGSQWIGKITVKELMELRNAQLINYNERTQRTLKHVVNKDFEYYQIFLNKKAVSEITNSFANNQYIPNTITLNIPEDAEFTYSHDQLIIYHADHLDILDGYHRYVAMSNLFNQDDKFDYTMELRVVCFSEETARQFIWQEDQKTKMKKMDSDSFNQNAPATQVVNLINQTGIFRNVIGRNNTAIDQGLATNLIDKLYFNVKKKIDRKRIIEVKNEIIDRFNALLDEDPNIFSFEWNREGTIVAFVLIANQSIPNESLHNDIMSLLGILTNNPELMKELGQKGNPVTARTITRVNKAYDNYVSKEV